MITGKILNCGREITFTAEGFRFLFIPQGYSKDKSAKENAGEIIGDNKYILAPDVAGFVYGKTQNGARIAIYIGKEIEIIFSRAIITWCYIIDNGGINAALANAVMKKRASKANDNSALMPSMVESDCFVFDGIKFENGAIKAINPCVNLEEDYDTEERLRKESGEYRLVYKNVDNSKVFNTKDGKIGVKWSFNSSIHQSRSVSDGIKLDNDTSVLQVEFSQKRSLLSFFNYYGYIKTLLSFLTFRKKIVFEKISLLKKHPEVGLVECAECHVKSEYDDIERLSTENQCSFGAEEKIRKTVINSPEYNGGIQRSVTEVVSVHLLDNSVFSKIVDEIINSGKKKYIPTMIIPVDSSDAVTVDLNRIRNICTELEIELNLSGMTFSRKEIIKSLIDEVVIIVKDYKENKGLPQKTFDSINGSISHWGDSLADRAIIAWRKYNEIILPVAKRLGIDVTDEMIVATVKARNRVTHEGFQGLNYDVVATAYVLQGLIYAMALKRIGVDEKTIKDIIYRGIL